MLYLNLNQPQLDYPSTSEGSKKTDRKTVNKEDIINILKDTHLSENQQIGGEINKDLESIINNDLNNSDSETSVSYTAGIQLNDESFEDVFSNIHGNRKSNKEISSIASEIFINNLLDDDKKENSFNQYINRSNK